jgi:uncharacterized membrane protein
MLGFIGIVALTSLLAPRVTRGDIFFGVTVRPGFADGAEARAVSRRYAWEIGFMAAVAALLVLTDPAPAASAPLLLGQAIGATLAFAKAHRSVAPFGVAPDAVREADLGPRPALPGGHLAQLGPFLMLLAAAVYIGLHWEQIPPRFPTHWNLAGKPNGWTAKSATSVYRAIALGLIACGMGLFRSLAVLHQTRLPRVTGTDGAVSRRVRHVVLLSTLAEEYVVATLIGWATVLAMFSTEPAMLRLPLPIRLAPFVLGLGVAATVIGLRRAAAATTPPVGDTTPDGRWILGVIYADRRDPALFVEKRMGVGYTLNMGNPWSWLTVMIGIAAVATALIM